MANQSKLYTNEFAYHMGMAVRAFVEVFKEVSNNFVPVIVENILKAYGAIHDVYVAAGAHYGDTIEGLQQWVKEQNETLNDGKGM